jgi:hypothetical protein
MRVSSFILVYIHLQGHRYPLARPRISSRGLAGEQLGACCSPDSRHDLTPIASISSYLKSRRAPAQFSRNRGHQYSLRKNSMKEVVGALLDRRHSCCRDRMHANHSLPTAEAALPSTPWRAIMGSWDQLLEHIPPNMDSTHSRN